MKRTGTFRIIRLAGLFLLFALLFSCGDKNPLAPVEERAENEIWITDSGFEPARLTITLGESVVFTNKDNETHAVESGTRDNPNTNFYLDTIEKGESEILTLTQKGSYLFYDIDSHATGTIIVL